VLRNKEILNVLVNEVNPIVEKAAEQMGIQTIYIYSILVNRSELFPDGLHPNADGAKIIAE
jgi:lysophospholipase L1-like esterase